jgi:DNA-binding CsgD family transcriptional regulator
VRQGGSDQRRREADGPDATGAAAGPRELVGRERELEALDELIGHGGGVLMLEGGAGIGKTALVDAARGRGRLAGALVLSARGDELETAYPYGVVRQWLEREWASAGADPGDPAELALSRSPSAAPAGEDASLGILHALYLFLSDLSQRCPVLLTLDDAQWADLPSLRFLVYIKHRLDGLPIGVVVATRPDADALLDRVRRDPAVDARALGPLDERAAARLLEREFGTPVGGRFVAACVRVTGGNPLYLRELARALSTEDVAPRDDRVARVHEIGVEALSGHVLRRVIAAGPDALRLAGAMCVLGDGGALRHAAAMAGLAPARAGVLAGLLVRAAILRDDDPVRFVHPIVRRVLVEQLTSIERDDLHRHAARLLIEARAAPEQAAAHLLLTRPSASDWSVETLRAAAAEAMARSAFEAASLYLRRALDEPPDGAAKLAVERELGIAEAQLHDPRGVERLRRVREASDDPLQRAEIALDLAPAYMDLFRPIEACQVFEDALAELNDDDSELRHLLEAGLAMSAWMETETVPSGVRVLGKYWDHTPRGPLGRVILAQNAMTGLMTGQPAEHVRAAARDALHDAGEDDSRGTFEVALSALILAEGFDEASAGLERALGLRAIRVVQRRMASMETLAGLLALRLGALGEAELRLRAALELTPAAAGPAGWLVVRGLLASALTSQGNLAEAERVLRDAPPEPWPMDQLSSLALAGRAELHLAHGRLSQGVDDLLRIGELQRQSGGATAPAAHYWRARAALALHALGRSEEARTMLADELGRARAFGAPVALGSTLRAAGIVEGGRHGLDLLREALTILHTSPAVLERALAHVELGAALRRDNQRRAARAELDAGLRLAQSWGARPLAQRAYDELAASGTRLRPADLEDRDTLTPSELRVAQYAAKGLTNREIAAQLYLSPKTVEMHLGRAYRKLDITGRPQLAEALQQHT